MSIVDYSIWYRMCVFFFKQKTAYEMRISDWSSDVCSSDLILLQELRDGTAFFYLRNVNSGHPGSITTIHADSAELAFEQLTLLVKESEGGADLARDDIRSLLKLLVDVVVQTKK